MDEMKLFFRQRTRAAALPSIDIYFLADNTYDARNKSWKRFVPTVGNNLLSRRAHRSLGAEMKEEKK
jgi:hypothetical protein